MLLCKGPDLGLLMRWLVGRHACMRMFERGATARTTNCVCDTVHAPTTPLSLGHIAHVAGMAFVCHGTLMNIVQVLPTLVNI